MNKNSKSEMIALVLLLLATLIWGSSFIFVKMAIAKMNLYYFLFIRFFVAGAIMFAVFRRRMLNVDAATIRAALILGVMLSASFIAQTEGLRFTAAANSALITCLYMVFTPLFLLIFKKTRVEMSSVLGVVLALVGMFLLTYYSLTGMNVGDAITVACAVMLSWHLIYTGKYSVKHSLVPLVGYQFLFTSVFCGAIAAIQGGFTLDIPRIGVFALAFTAVFATAIAFFIQTYAQRVLSPTRTGVICSMESVFGALIPWCIGFETPTILSIVGACLMVAGMLVSEVKGSDHPCENVHA